MSGLLTPETLAQLTASISPCGSLDIRTILGLTPSPRFSPSNVSPLNFGIISTPVARPINPEPMDFDISTPPNLHELTPVSLGNGSNQVEQVDRASIQAEAVDINSHQAEAVDIGSHQAEAVDIGSHQAEDVDIGCRQAEAVDTMTIESSFLQTLNTFCKLFYGREEDAKQTSRLVTENRNLTNEISVLKDKIANLENDLSALRRGPPVRKNTMLVFPSGDSLEFLQTSKKMFKSMHGFQLAEAARKGKARVTVSTSDIY